VTGTRLIKLSGLSAIVGGVIIILARVTQVALYGATPLSIHASKPAFVPAVGVPGYAGGALLLLGVIGLYACQARKLGTLGSAAFVVAFLGISLSSAANWSYAFASPLFARLDPQLLATDFLDERWGILGDAFLASYLAGGLGWLLLGVMTLVARVLPVWVGPTMVVTMALAAVVPIGTTGPGAILVNVLIAAGPISFGYALWSLDSNEGSA
jgi:hypothetical protein